MENASCPMGLPVSDMEMRDIGRVSENSDSRHFSDPSDQLELVEANSFDPMFNTSDVSSIEVSNYESSDVPGFSPVWMSNQLLNEDEAWVSGISGHEKPLPVKRKASMGYNSYNFISEQQIFPNKRPVYSEDGLSSSGVLQQPSPMGTGSASPNTRFPALHSQSTVSKKPLLADAVTAKSGFQREQPVKKQATQRQSASKTKQESSESVRSKMRESLAAALALTSPSSNKTLDAKKDQDDDTLTDKTSGVTNASEPTPTMAGNAPASGKVEAFPNREISVAASTNNSRIPKDEVPSSDSALNAGGGGGTFPEFQYTSVLGDEDSHFNDLFFVKDDLLQGNGLSWAFDLDAQMNDWKEVQSIDYENSARGEANEQRDVAVVDNLAPEDVAIEIEAELFKLFGGVNKKYKEKGRSLLFNLKDASNPELRGRVMSGEISPQRLCSMSAEELASKELSEWRMAKAEELAQMKVLPEVDIRSLVRKTHKGEYQVEIQQDDNIIAADLSGGVSISVQPQSDKAAAERTSPSKVSPRAEDGSQVNVSANQPLVRPTDGGADLIQKTTAGESKDPVTLPSVVSFDEFVESRNSEPQSSDANQKSSRVVSHERSKISGKTVVPALGSSSPKVSNSSESHDATKKSKSSSPPGGSPDEKLSSSIAADDEAEYIWKGVLQFNTSSSVRVCATFQSGEKTPTKLWPSSLDIKGRVRLGAFEKFIQELPLSRTRAVMVLELELNDKASAAQLSNLKQAIELYSVEERLGYAEPAPGVEIYLCPLTPRVASMVKHYYQPKETTDEARGIVEQLIGVVVWRRSKSGSGGSSSSSRAAAVSSSSSSPTGHGHGHKHGGRSSKAVIHGRPQKHPRRLPPDSKARSSKPAAAAAAEMVTATMNGEDDVPPGFGPGGAAKDEDDLPEFNFSAVMMNHPRRRRVDHDAAAPAAAAAAQSSVDKVRELIQKYGQSSTTRSSPVDDMNTNNNAVPVPGGVVPAGFESWDDDDDIPEWRPEAYGGAAAAASASPAGQAVAPAAAGEVGFQPPGSHRWVQTAKTTAPNGGGARWRPY